MPTAVTLGSGAHTLGWCEARLRKLVQRTAGQGASSRWGGWGLALVQLRAGIQRGCAQKLSIQPCSRKPCGHTAGYLQMLPSRPLLGTAKHHP